MPGCARHPDRPTGLRCVRCGRPACPECLREAAVGYQCVECVAEARRGSREPVTVAGGRPRAKPFVVPALVLINVVFYALTAVQAGNPADNADSQLFAELALWPLAVAGGHWWELISAGFQHIGLVHLALNMVALWVIGRDLEIVLGRVRFVAVYMLSLLGGSVAVFLFGNPLEPVAGASGAIFGLMGSIAVAAFRLKVSLRPVLVIIALNVAISVSLPGISLLGHLGGLAVGAVSTAALVYAPRVRRDAWQLGLLVGVLFVLVALLLLRDVQFGPVMCSGVGALHCVPG